MRLLIALLAVLALISNPIAAAAAQAACDRAGPAMAGMDTSGMASMNTTHEPGQQHKKAAPSCAQSCATICGVAVALPSSPLRIKLARERTIVAARPDLAAHPHEPAGLERPPKSIT
ncbi:MAG: hypothetical protein ACR2FH_04050 [Caulobacteraceae bacterium]